MKCPNCGKEIANDSKFCEFCGVIIQKSNKQVDIRWMLLPALVVAMLAVFNFSIDPKSAKTIYGVIAFTPMVLTFLVSLWFGIKKKMPYSFIVVVGLVTVTNLWMVFACNNPWKNDYMYDCFDSPGASIYFRSDGELNIIKMEDYISSFSLYSEREEEFQKYSHAVVKELERRGKKDVHEYSDTYSYCYPSNLYWSLFITEFFLVLLYIIYAILAEKNRWKF